jgi:hypothetical protein
VNIDRAVRHAPLSMDQLWDIRAHGTAAESAIVRGFWLPKMGDALKKRFVALWAAIRWACGIVS